ncbi:MAG: hypothetical protein IJ081_00190 [Prevotella sp.]|nr:hypothetical protein [Prevotella sp.]
MKKLLICSCTLLFICCTLTSCSSDDAYGEDASSEVKLAWIKQQYYNYARQYGIINIDFDDSLLMKHLNLTKSDIERDVITMAMSTGTCNVNSSSLRKKAKKRGVDENEEEEHHVFVYVDGVYDKTITRRDSIVITYSACYFFSELGSRSFNVSLISVKKQKQGSSDEEINTNNVIFNGSFDTYSGSIGGYPGETASLDLFYTLFIKIQNENYEENFSDTKHVAPELKELFSA